MHKLAAVSLAAATLAVAVMNAGPAAARGGGSSGGSTTSSSGTWPTAFPLPTSPGTVLSQSSTSAVVRSTDTVTVVKQKLDDLYVTQKGCTLRLAVNKPKDYLCYDPATGKTAEVYFTFAALDPTATDPSHSQSNAFLANG